MSSPAIQQAVRDALSAGKKRNFVQTVELIVNLRDLKPNKPEGQVDLTVRLPHATGKASGKTLLFGHSKAFVDAVRDRFDTVVMDTELEGLARARVNEIARHDVLFAEGPAMLAVARHLGQELAPRGKMPRPITGGPETVPALLKSASSTTRVTNKRGKGIPVVQVVVGKEDMDAAAIAENVSAVLGALVQALPRQKQNLKNALLKKSMAPPVRVPL